MDIQDARISSCMATTLRTDLMQLESSLLSWASWWTFFLSNTRALVCISRKSQRQELRYGVNWRFLMSLPWRHLSAERIKAMSRTNTLCPSISCLLAANYLKALLSTRSCKCNLWSPVRSWLPSRRLWHNLRPILLRRRSRVRNSMQLLRCKKSNKS